MANLSVQNYTAKHLDRTNQVYLLLSHEWTRNSELSKLAKMTANRLGHHLSMLARLGVVERKKMYVGGGCGLWAMFCRKALNQKGPGARPVYFDAYHLKARARAKRNYERLRKTS